MKKSLAFLGIALATLVSCTNDEVTEVAQNRAIRFDSFVENNTKTVTEVTSLSNFYVFGQYAENGTSYDKQIFNNELSTTTYYWVTGKNYSFGAYADGVTSGNANKIDGASFSYAEGKLTFTDYTPNDAKDLVVATAKQAAPANGTDKVSLTFKHMLSQVKFTFNTTDGEQYTLKVSDLKFNAINKATGTYTGATKANPAITWTKANANPNADYSYTKLNEVDITTNGTASSESKLVIPQSATNNIKVTFTASVEGPGINATTKNFEATLGINTENEWKPGYRYNYTATITADKIVSGLNKIEFTPTVEQWQNTNPEFTPVNPQEQTQP